MEYILDKFQGVFKDWTKTGESGDDTGSLLLCKRKLEKHLKKNQVKICMERSSSSFSHKTIPRILRMNKNKIVTDHMRLSKSENPFKSASVLYHQDFISLQEILITTAFDG